jgi:hypothetical protein
MRMWKQFSIYNTNLERFISNTHYSRFIISKLNTYKSTQHDLEAIIRAGVRHDPEDMKKSNFQPLDHVWNVNCNACHGMEQLLSH